MKYSNIKSFSTVFLAFFIFSCASNNTSNVSVTKKIEGEAPDPNAVSKLPETSSEVKKVREALADGKYKGYYKVGRPYSIQGKTYYPQENENHTEVGIASWYGPNFHLKQTANGELFDMNLYSAAHRTLPMPTIVKVTNLENNKSIVLRVNDRGPFSKNRVIDLSKAAAKKLDYIKKGTARVKVEYLRKAEIGRLAEAPKNIDVPANFSYERESITGDELPNVAFEEKKVPQIDDMSVRSEKFIGKDVVLEDVEDGISSYHVQFGAFSELRNAESLIERLPENNYISFIKELKSAGKLLYAVRIGVFFSKTDAQAAISEFKSLGIKNAVVVKSN